MTFDFSGYSLSPGYLMGGSIGGDDVTSDVSVVSSPLSDRGPSPVPSVSSVATTSTMEQFLAQRPATGTTSFRRHSIGQTEAPLGGTSSERTVSKRAMSEDVDGDACNAGIDQNQHNISDVRASKRICPYVTATSAPALMTVPLPTVDPAQKDITTDTASRKHEDDSSNSTSSPVARHPTPISASSTSTTTTASTSAPAHAAPPARAARRTRRKAGAATRPKRTQCVYCHKTFTRVQDADRHIATSCSASPEKKGVECPECGAVLSRNDAAMRHWRGAHENSTCEPPEWARRA